jgi:AraC-like DNA-binding protein
MRATVPSPNSPAQRHLLRGWGRDISFTFVEQFGFNHITAARALPWDRHDGVELILVVEGEVRWEVAGGESYAMVGGQLSVMPPRTTHRALGDIHAPCTLFWVMYRPFTAANLENSVFGPADLATLGEMSRERTVVYDSSPRLLDSCNGFRRLLLAQKQRRLDALECAELRALLCAATTETCRIVRRARTRKTSIFVARAKEYFARRIEEPFPIEAAIRHIGFSRSRFYEMFKSETGLTPNDYVQRLRIGRACEILAGSDESITGIACRMGFSDSQYFARVFRKYMGETPSEYRDRALVERQP